VSRKNTVRKNNADMLFNRTRNRVLKNNAKLAKAQKEGNDVG
jgi:hypothetical protein